VERHVIVNWEKWGIVKDAIAISLLGRANRDRIIKRMVGGKGRATLRKMDVLGSKVTAKEGGAFIDLRKRLPGRSAQGVRAERSAALQVRREGSGTISIGMSRRKFVFPGEKS